MALSKERVQDKIEIVGKFKAIQLRYADQIVEDGNVISQSYHRDMIVCGDYAKADEHNVRAIADAVWTADLIAEFQATLPSEVVEEVVEEAPAEEAVEEASEEVVE